MKLIFMVLLAVLFLPGCSRSGGNARTGNDGTITLGERLFVNQIVQILMEPDAFLGQTIRYEGLFRTLFWTSTGQYHDVVIRLKVCCDPDGEPIGFEVRMGDRERFAENTWVEVTGVLKADYSFGRRAILLDVVNIQERQFGNALVR